MDQSKRFEGRLGAGLNYADIPRRLSREQIEELTSEPHGVQTAHHSEAAARFVAYAGPYLFWALVAVLAAGILLLR